MNMFVPVLMTIAACCLSRGSMPKVAAALPSAVRLRRIVLLLLVNAILFSILGGALLCRYLLPCILWSCS